MRLQQLPFTFSTLLPVFSGVYGLFPRTDVPRDAQASIPCLTSSIPTTLVDLISCFDAYTVPRNAYADETAYNAAQPNSEELSAWNAVVASLLAVDGNCGSALLPAALNGAYAVNLFTEAGGKSYCVLSETQATGSHYTRGWGLMAVPANHTAVSRYVHISAPHPIYDPGTPQQAAAAFGSTGAKSLFVAGRHRDAYLASSCVSADYGKTDPAHDTNELFFSANKAMLAWQTANGGCPTASCAFIQIHRQSSCPNDTAFVSAGIGRAASSVTWYNTVDSPAKRIKGELITAFPSWTVSLPSDTTSTCDLTATNNVFGRLLNGITESSVCTSEASASTVTGQFVHIEQADSALVPANYGAFSGALNHAIATTCGSGMQMDSTSLLCV